MSLRAGYDSWAIRFSDLAQQTKIFEFDTQATRSRKLTCIARVQLDLRPQTKYVCMNVNQSDTGSLLGESGYDSALKTLFILEGLTMYLPELSV